MLSGFGRKRPEFPFNPNKLVRHLSSHPDNIFLDENIKAFSVWFILRYTSTNSSEALTYARISFNKKRSELSVNRTIGSNNWIQLNNVFLALPCLPGRHRMAASYQDQQSIEFHSVDIIEEDASKKKC